MPSRNPSFQIYLPGLLQLYGLICLPISHKLSMRKRTEAIRSVAYHEI
jgi:hypothetical protein